MSDKVYLVHEDCIWDDECYPKIVGATTNKEIAQVLLKDYVKQIKEDVDFDTLDLVNEESIKDFCEDGCWIYSESNTHFSLYLNGEYNSYHININIECLPLYKSLNEEYEINNDNSL